MRIRVIWGRNENAKPGIERLKEREREGESDRE